MEHEPCAAGSGVPLTTDTVNERRPDPRYFEIRRVLNSSRGYYDAAKFRLLVPRWRGFTLDASYWFSKAIDLESNYTSTATSSDAWSSQSQSEFNAHSEMRALSTFDQPHALLTRVSYELPQARGQKSWAEAVLGGWQILPALNIYNQQWPLRTASYPLGAAKFSPDGEGRHGYATDSIISTGCIIVGAKVVNSVFGRSVFVDSGAEIEDSIVLANCRIGAGARIRRAILDRNVELSPGEEIGFDAERDRSLYDESESGIVVVEGRRSPVPIVRISI